MELHLKIIGILFMLMAISHVFMPKYFDWKNDFKNLSLFNKQMVKTHTFFIVLTVFGIGFLSFFESAALIQTILGKKIALPEFKNLTQQIKILDLLYEAKKI